MRELVGIIRKKRDGEGLTDAEVAAVVRGMTDSTMTDGQVAAFGMAVFLRGMSETECLTLTRAMAQSGRTLDWSTIVTSGPVLDKHSTGGVGDKVSLALVPLVASCGAYVPMVSGRGLGHTGGTVDKLESIPGYETAPAVATFQRVVRDVGCAIVGQTEDLAPADRRFYAIRDVTATVESLPLITASILAKKLAAGLGALVMDVKAGNGAFAESKEAAQNLAQSLVSVASRAGLPARALITDMSQVLGRTAGNALEVREAIAYLTGAQRDPRLHALVLALGAELLVEGRLAGSPSQAHRALETALASGRAAERFGRMVAALGGPGDLVDTPERYLAPAPIVRAVHPDRPGVITSMDTRALGLAVVRLGGGRSRADQGIDHVVGLSDVRGTGEAVGPREPLALIHGPHGAAVDRAIGEIRGAFRVGDRSPDPTPIVLARVS